MNKETQKKRRISITVNEKVHVINSSDNTPLLWVLRDELGLTGTKYGCGKSICGNCAVLLNGKAIQSCRIPVVEVSGQSITTIEGVSYKNELHPVQEAWLECSVPECGYCQPGQIITAISLLENEPVLTKTVIERTMSNVLCRCGTYQKVRLAIEIAAKKLNKKIYE